jgi:hypothetical protein
VNLNIIYSIGSKDHFAIFDEILKKGPLSSRECLSIDGEDDPADVVQFFFDKGYSGAIGFGDGTAGPGPHLPRIMDRAAYLRASAGYPTMIPDVFLISEPTSMNFFIDAGVDGMIVTDGSQQQAVDIVKNVHDEVHLATREENPFQPLNEAYGIQIITGNDGTDADIKFTLHGCRGNATITVNSGYFISVFPVFYDTHRFEADNYDWVTIPSKDLGEIKSITIYNLGGANNSQWQVKPAPSEGLEQRPRPSHEPIADDAAEAARQRPAIALGHAGGKACAEYRAGHPERQPHPFAIERPVGGDPPAPDRDRQHQHRRGETEQLHQQVGADGARRAEEITNRSGGRVTERRVLHRPGAERHCDERGQRDQRDAPALGDAAPDHVAQIVRPTRKVYAAVD